ncbi:MAG: hypothetical protein AAFY71_06910 [Bacteroidota bacterium]
MKYLFLILASLAFVPYASADVGECYLMYVELQTTKGETKEGFIQYTFNGRVDSFQVNDDLTSYLNQFCYKEIPLFRQIQQLDMAYWGLEKLTAVATEDIDTFSCEQISSIKLLEPISGCEWGKLPNGNYGYSSRDFSIQVYAGIIQELTQEEIDRMNAGKPLHRANPQHYDVDNVLAFNYNKDLSKEEFEDLVNRIELVKREEEDWKTYVIRWMANYREQKTFLRNNNIIVFTTFSYS